MKDTPLSAPLDLKAIEEQKSQVDTDVALGRYSGICNKREHYQTLIDQIKQANKEMMVTLSKGEAIKADVFTDVTDDDKVKRVLNEVVCKSLRVDPNKR